MKLGRITGNLKRCLKLNAAGSISRLTACKAADYVETHMDFLNRKLKALAQKKTNRAMKKMWHWIRFGCLYGLY
jgi:hypothetical protein